ncbi:MAG: hypothetical protein KW793_03760 [Candidatus Doudnabacteria bacterium]|nr:hypothetical protein [Candidatus Doudnabacteria bacterium]
MFELAAAVAAIAVLGFYVVFPLARFTGRIVGDASIYFHKWRKRPTVIH